MAYGKRLPYAIYFRIGSSYHNSKGGGSAMAVEMIDEKYKCNECGNEVVVTKVGGGTLVCCGQDMERIELVTLGVMNVPDADDYLE
jgi:desulfoferrodoxin-like iron-binding protein